MDLILKDAFFYSRGRTLFADIVISGDEILKVGRVLKEDYKDFERIDCRNKLILPAFTDSHLHLEALAHSLEEIDLRDSRSLEEVLSRIARFAEQLPPGEWITGGRWDKNIWEKPVFPTHRELDRVTGDHPAMLWSKDGHALWVNSLVLKLLNIERTTPDPPGGKILRDEEGEPSGILLENAADLYGGKFARPEENDREANLTRAAKYLNQQGITGCNWFLEKNEDPLSILSFIDALNLDLDVTLWFPKESLEAVMKSGLKSGEGTERVKFGGIKLFADGALGSQTAFLLAPYEGSHSSGIEVTSEKELEEVINVAAKHDIAVAVHAIGDAAVRNAIQAFYPQRALNQKLRNRLEHVQLIHPQDRVRLSESGLLASVQPIHAVSDRKMASLYWGERVKYSYSYRSLHDSGIPLAFGSDAPVEDPSVLKGIYAACARKTPFISEEPFLPQEAIDLKDALDAYTYWGAWSTFQDKEKGEIAPGKKADLVVLSENILNLPLIGLREVKVLSTIFRGKISDTVLNKDSLISGDNRQS
ncbi:MAG: amidohydrolase [Coprothermobacterota bacterium]|nr:amidohydrolase [Coprothermobacterota bacterium]